MAEATVDTNDMSRREFLYYVWGASMALITAESVGALIWFLIPKFKEGEFGGKFSLPFDKLPEINDIPFNFAEGRFWLVNLNTTNSNERMYLAEDEQNEIEGIAAIYKVCTHLGCIYAWNIANQRFECPCHGSKYRLDGRRVESPAPRSLDRFQVTLEFEDGTLAEATADEDGFWQPVPTNNKAIANIIVDTGSLKKGPSLDLICSFRGNCP